MRNTRSSSQRDVGLGILGEEIVVVPAGHPVLDVVRIAREPFLELAIVEVARFAVEELLDG